MSKKPNISKEAQVLLKLLRIALGTEPRKYFGEVVEPFPEGIDWREVVRLSYEHKVSAIAVDGLEASKYDPYQGLDEKQTEELKAVLVPWIKDVENTEWSYCYYVEVLKTLCQIFKDNGLTPIILKGYGLSLNYPRPSHRGVGDIDLFLVDGDGRPAAEEGNRIAKDVLGLNVTMEDDGHHSRFTFKGILVENHYELMGTNWGGSREEELGSLLNNMLIDESVIKNGFYLPSDTFYSVYLLQHMFSHLSCGNFTFRQLLDYAFLLQRCSDNIDWQRVDDIVTRFGMKQFSDGIIGLLSKMFSFSLIHCSPSNSCDTVLINNMLSDILYFNVVPNKGLHIFKHYYVNRWHYNYYKNRSMISSILLHILLFLKSKMINRI